MKWVAGFALALLVVTPMSAASVRQCWVEPNPVLLGSPFEVHATGLTPRAFYYLNITQAKDPSNNAHPNGGLDTDETGSGVSYFSSTSWANDGVLGVGDAKVRVYSNGELVPWQLNVAKGTANCIFTVA